LCDVPCSGDGTLRKYVLDAGARDSDSAAAAEV
jgi:16S rRNA C967 or C1407 C5-methylase (RsmB/RsmF family)